MHPASHVESKFENLTVVPVQRSLTAGATEKTTQGLTQKLKRKSILMAGDSAHRVLLFFLSLKQTLSASL